MSRLTNTVEVEEGQYVPIPETKTMVLAGPAAIKITRYPNGQASGEVLRGSPISLELAVKRNLARVSWDV